MSDLAIRIEGLGKCYRIGGSEVRYHTLRESIMEMIAGSVGALKSLVRRERRHGANSSFWALKDVTFEVGRGEVTGIIGRNGAGKSTLLKVLSRITEPTEGWADIHGRVGSLLEVGTGFHPELTGRENIYLNGSILGMKREEIKRRFHEIVAFSEVEKFLDTPVKRYSSGMQVRLAFAVAAHLEPDILIVDEVLAVGDATYQRRCIERMERLARSGVTVLFVSHNMELIPRLCRKAVLLSNGRVEEIGEAGQVTNHYLKKCIESIGMASDLSTKVHGGDGRAVFHRLQILDSNGQPTTNHVSGEDMVLSMEIHAKEFIPDVALAVVLQNMYGTRIITSWTREAGYHVDLVPGIQTIKCRFREVRLRPGHRLRVGLWMATQVVIDLVEDAEIIEIVASKDVWNYSTDQAQGIVLSRHEWSYEAPN